jgi:tetratricopeptide (TPR) repeat protein
MFLPAVPVAAQDWRGKGRLDGWVKDPSGNAIADAKVEIKRESGGGTSTKTNKKGYWAILGLRGGTWNVDVSAPGFATRQVSVAVSEGVRVPSMEISLEPAAPAPATSGAALPQAGAGPEIIAALELGNKLIAEKKWAEARAEYEKANAAVPDNTAILGGIAQTYHGEGNREKTVEILRKIVELDPNDTQNRILLANILLELGKLEEGKAMLDALPPGSISDPGVYMNLGILFMNKNKGEDARAYLTKAIELDPASADGYYYRGLALIQAKKNAEAKADLQKYLQLKPDGPEAKEVREILQALK